MVATLGLRRVGFRGGGGGTWATWTMTHAGRFLGIANYRGKRCCKLAEVATAPERREGNGKRTQGGEGFGIYAIIYVEDHPFPLKTE